MTEPKKRVCAECSNDGVEWRPVPDPRFVDSYEISNRGEVRSVDRMVTDRLGRTRRIAGRAIYRFVCKFGYHRYTLNYGGRRTRQSMAAHRLVALAFVGPCPGDDYEVMHLDHDPGHNHVSNLRWGTHSENVRATVDAGRWRSRHEEKTTCPQGHPYSGIDNRGVRICRICRNAAAAASRERKRVRQRAA